jgi:hypothetical protein
MFFSSKNTHISVASVADAFSRGNCCTKSPAPTTSAYAASSSRPSIVSGRLIRTARMVARPFSSRMTTAGDMGAGGPSIGIGVGSPTTIETVCCWAT